MTDRTGRAKQPSPTSTSGRFLLRILRFFVLLGGTVALALGVVVTACSLWPLTDMADAAVFSRVGPRWMIGGIVTLLLARWLGKRARRVSSPTRKT